MSVLRKLSFSLHRSKATAPTAGTIIDIVHHCAAAEIRHGTHHRRIEFGSDHFILTCNGNRNAEIREGQEEAQHEGGNAGTGDRTKRRSPKASQETIAHHARDDCVARIDVNKGIADDQENGRQQVSPHQQSAVPKTVNRKRRRTKELADKPHTAKGVNDGKAIGDRRQKERQEHQNPHRFLHPKPAAVKSPDRRQRRNPKE